MFPARRWISPREAAVYLDFHPQYVYELLAQGRLPAVKLGGAWRVDLPALEAELEKQIQERSVKGKTR